MEEIVGETLVLRNEIDVTPSSRNCDIRMEGLAS
jgi:hypothetical protein